MREGFFCATPIEFLKMKKKRALSLSDIVLLNLVAVTSLRWVASAASNGPSSISLWILASIFFFIPQALAILELSSRYPGEGGLYRWTQLALGDRHGFLCGWCYWVNNLLFFPTLLLYVAYNIAFAIHAANPNLQLENNKIFVTGITLGALWLVAYLSFVGLRVSRWLQNFGAIGNWIPALSVSVLGFLSFKIYGSANVFTFDTMIPQLGNLNQLTFFSQMCFALAGLELVSFFGGEIENPRRNLTLGLFFATVIILSIYLVGTLGVLLAVPQKNITLLNGLLLPLQQMGHHFKLDGLLTICAILIAIGGLGSTMAWFAGAARVPYLVGLDSYLPRAFSKLHSKFQTPYIAIIVQTVFATFFTLFVTVGAQTKMESAYKTMVDMCLILYFIPYCYLFLSLFILRRPLEADANANSVYRFPGGVRGRAVVGVVGLVTTLLAICTTVVPIDGIWASVAMTKTILGTAVMLTGGLVLYVWGKYKKMKTADLRA